ncbi:MAG: STAS domain-containing protein [Simkaniaceae bacterium]|nr:STAS domain-containing protein [Simkaniaceae bacterium]
MTVGLNVKEEAKGDKKVVRLDGRVDASSAPALETTLNEIVAKGNKALALDFTRVTYLSSAGMRLLLAMTKRMQGNGNGFVVFSIHDDVMEIIKMAGFERVLKICNNEADALAALA